MKLARKSVRVIVLYEKKDFYSKTWPPEGAVAFSEWFQEKLDLIPNEFKSSAKFVISADCEYECEYAEMTLYYERPETDWELAERQRKEDENEKAVRSAQEVNERAWLKLLKAKYGDPE